MRNVIEYMLQANQDGDEEVALESCEFWWVLHSLCLDVWKFTLCSLHRSRTFDMAPLGQCHISNSVARKSL